jgi:hypothetical protein
MQYCVAVYFDSTPAPKVKNCGSPENLWCGSGSDSYSSTYLVQNNENIGYILMRLRPEAK